ATHGTHEFYTWRAKISKRLIQEKKFSFIAVEGDWPDCYKVNRFLKNYPKSGVNANEVMQCFNRWPTWMWANWEMIAFIEWLKKHNMDQPMSRRIGFYGLDVYSLWESVESVKNYLKLNDKSSLNTLQQVINCFEPFGNREGSSYAHATQILTYSCETEVVNLLNEIRKKMELYPTDKESAFSTEQNALVAVNAEHYYRTMLKGNAASWNIRDRHMMETLNRLMKFHGENSKTIVWEHNTHIGDARATDMWRQGMINVGQLTKEEHEKEGVVRIGFSTYKGKVIAGSQWGGKIKVMELPEAKENSLEFVLHESSAKNKL
ncbi:MAG: erythromycin esterase family protein, partial [Bacteroidota bacterium]